MSDQGAKIAAVARAHAGCSSVNNPALYQDVVRRPADAGVMFDGFYMHNRDMSSCALFAVGCLRLAGCTAPECTAPYFPKGGPERDAIVDLETLARVAKAWVPGSSALFPFKAGDIYIIANAQGGDGHVGVCVADAVVQPDGSWTVADVEGGQYSGSDSSAIQLFDGSDPKLHPIRTWKRVGGRWMLGDRYLMGYVSAALLPFPVEAEADDEDPHSSPGGAAA